MPVKTSVGSVLCAFVLQEKWTLLSSELFQIPEKNTKFQNNITKGIVKLAFYVYFHALHIAYADIYV